MIEDILEFDFFLQEVDLVYSLRDYDVRICLIL